MVNRNIIVCIIYDNFMGILGNYILIKGSVVKNGENCEKKINWDFDMVLLYVLLDWWCWIEKVYFYIGFCCYVKLFYIVYGMIFFLFKLLM